MKVKEFSWTFLFIIILIGAWIGGILGQAISAWIPGVGHILTKGIEISLQSTTLDLYFLQIPLGFVLKFNLISIVGIFAVFYLLKKL